MAKKETFADQGYTKQYTSARLNSKFAFTYGRIEVRAKLPTGVGTWPAIWMLPTHNTYGNWPKSGEIDIMEHGIFPTKDINYINSALHTTCCNGGNPNQGGTIASDLANQFHVYSMNWSPNQITFLLDSVAFYTYNPINKDASTWPFFEDQFILLNVAMGGLAGNIDPGFTESAMLIDYVKVYQASGLSFEDEPSLNKTLKVYPNPSNDEIHISSNVSLNSIALYDILGKLILRKVKDTNSIDVSNLNAGVYILVMHSENEKNIKKVTVK